MIDPMKGYPGYLLRRVSAASMAALGRRLDALELRPSEATVLLVIESNPGARSSDIGRLLDIASANMTPLIARLVEQELLERQAVDGRSRGLSLTARGRALTARIHAIIDRHEEELLARIPARQREAFIAALRNLLEQDAPSI